MNQDNKSKDPIKVSNLDLNFRSNVAKHKEANGLAACFSCGTCTAECPLSEIFPEYSPRKLAKMVKLGMKKAVLSSPYIWYCVTCRNCEHHCPQNVKFFDVLNVLKNMAAKQGYAPSPWVEQTQQIIQSGLIYPTDEALAEKRKSFSLPALKSDNKKARRLIELAGLDKIKPKKKVE
jgi:heterodisulfide reductase subunit C